MAPDRWREVWQVYEQACALPASERALYVEDLADPEIRLQIRTLLEALDDPALEASQWPSIAEEPETEAVTDEWPELGKSIGRFTITGCLGRGASGQVYSGMDTELGRPVAMKFSALSSLGSPLSIRRAIREARTASALNHPNIVTVYDVIRSEPSIVIVMELVSGQPMQRLCGQVCPLEDVADWGSQIAGALASAHGSGIVHRDIKPENLMLRTDGAVKVLDFGLARETLTDTIRTLGGLVAGTLRYMSPEQTRAETATSASDMFSLGIVLYELAAGVHPFAAASPLSTAHFIGSQEAAPPSRVNPAIPGVFDELVMAMLDKDPGRRPAAAAVAERLAELQRNPPARETGSRPRFGRAVAAALAGIAALGLGWLAFHRIGVSRASPPAAFPLVFTPLTNMTGNEGQPEFSPDGRRVVFVSDHGKAVGRDVYVRALSSPDIRRLTSDAADNFDPVWSPDGTQIAFLQRSTGAPLKIISVPASGGVERTIGALGGVPWTNHRRIAWFPDGRSLVVSEAPSDDPENPALFWLDPRSGRRQRLTAPPPDRSDTAPQFSPDGHRLAFLRVSRGPTCELFVMDVDAHGETGEPRRMVASTNPIDSFQWAPDSRTLLYGSGPDYPARLWQVAADGGVPTPADFTLSGPARQLAVADKGNLVAYVRPLTDANIWKFDIQGRVLGTVAASPREEHEPRYSPDGTSVVYASRRTGSSEIWVAKDDGSHPRQLTFQEADASAPNWAPDGRRIAYESMAGGRAFVWMVNADGGELVRLGEGAEDGANPSWSRDGIWIYFCLNRGGQIEIWKQRASGGGGPIQVTFHGGAEGMESFDGRYFYYTKAMDVRGLWRKPVEGDAQQESPREEAIPELADVQFRYWDIAPTGIYFVDVNPKPVLKFFSFATRQSTALAHLRTLPTGAVYQGFSVAPNGRTFLYLQYDAERTEIDLVRRDQR